MVSAFLSGYGGGGGGVILVFSFGVLCVVCSKGGVVQRNYLPPSGAIGPDQ
jgi:hypothetical protein